MTDGLHEFCGDDEVKVLSAELKSGANGKQFYAVQYTQPVELTGYRNEPARKIMKGSGMTDWRDDMTKIAKRVDVTALSLYDCKEIVDEIELAAAENDGELSERQIQKLVEAQTQSIVKLQKLCGAIAHYEQGVEFCKAQENRIKEARQRAEKRIESVKKYLTPYVQQAGKPVQAGTFTLSIRRSTSTLITGVIDDLAYSRTIPATIEPDKAKIREALQAGKEIRNAQLVTNHHLQIK